MEDHPILSERLEDQLKAIKWAREQKKILDIERQRTVNENQYAAEDQANNKK